jgi:hypothetical protein
MPKSVYLASITLALLPVQLAADSFRCGPDLIQEGIFAAEVVEKCGEPTSVETVTEPLMARNADGFLYQVGVTTKEIWRYDRGSRMFPVRLTIKDGVAEEIELLSRIRPGEL